MAAVKLSGWVRADRKLVVEIPADIPLGLVDILILPKKDPQAAIASTQLVLWTNRLEQLRKQLLTGQMLSRVRSAPLGYIPLSDEDRMALVKLPPGIKATDTLIDEDRGPR